MTERDDLICAARMVVQQHEAHCDNIGEHLEGEDAARFSEAVHRRDTINRLTREIARIGRRCGDCSKWMKSRECPKERNVDGMSHGPSMDAMICLQFVECWSASQRREELTAQLNAVLRKEATP